MKYGRLTEWAAVAAAACAALLVAPGSSVHAAAMSSTASYRLTTSSDLAAPTASSSGPQVIALVVPPGAIVPPTNPDGTQSSPLTILSSSAGFDQNQLIVALKDNGVTGSGAQQYFGLSFVGSGLKSAANGGHLDFSLNVDSSLSTPPTLQSTTPGVTITPLNTTPTTTVSSTPPPTTTTPVVTQAQVPEPMSIALWSVLAGVGLMRVRSARRKAVNS